MSRSERPDSQVLRLEYAGIPVSDSDLLNELLEKPPEENPALNRILSLFRQELMKGDLYTLPGVPGVEEPERGRFVVEFSLDPNQIATLNDYLQALNSVLNQEQDLARVVAEKALLEGMISIIEEAIKIAIQARRARLERTTRNQKKVILHADLAVTILNGDADSLSLTSGPLLDLILRSVGLGDAPRTYHMVSILCRSVAPALALEAAERGFGAAAQSHFGLAKLVIDLSRRLGHNGAYAAEDFTGTDEQKSVLLQFASGGIDSDMCVDPNGYEEDF